MSIFARIEELSEEGRGLEKFKLGALRRFGLVFATVGAWLRKLKLGAFRRFGLVSAADLKFHHRASALLQFKGERGIGWFLKKMQLRCIFILP